MRFKNYILDIVATDKERSTYQNRHNICISGIDKIIKGCALEIKKNIESGKYQRSLCSELKTNKATIESWLYGHNPIPILKCYELILVWKRVCKKTQREFSEKWDEVYEHIDIFSSNRSKKAILPKELTEDIAYLMGFILADGYIKNDEKLLQRGEYPEYTIALYDNSREFLEQLNIFFKQIFNVTCNLHFAKDKKGSWYVLRCTSKPVHRFFTLVLGIKKGNKTGNIDTPDIIKKSSEDIQKSFVSGFFDGEMGVGITKKNPWLEMAQSSITKEPVPIIIWMKKKLEKWGIDLHGPSLMSNQNAWRLRTNSKTTISKYYSIISSRHPDKIKQFEEIERFYYDTNRS